MASLSDVLSTLQNGVVAINNFGTQIKGSFNNISSQLTTNTSNIAANTAAIAALNAGSYVTSIAGNSSAFTLNGPSGITNTVNDIKLSQGSSSQFGAIKVDGTTMIASAGIISTVNPLPAQLHASSSADIALNNTANYFDGPTITQGTSGTWWASGSVTVQDTAGAAQIRCKLWDSTTVIDSGVVTTPSANALATVSLSGYLATPSSNIKISCKDVTATTGKILFNQSGESKDATVSAYRIA